MSILKKKNILLVVLAVVLVCIPIIGFAAVNAENSHSYGDINGDGDINTKDIVRLMKYIANNGEGIEAYGTDLNNDNVTNSKDLVRLMKYIANGGSNSDDSSDVSSSDSVTTVPDTESPEPDNFIIEGYFDDGDKNEIVAFADDQIYAFSGLRGFFGYTPAETDGGILFADSELLADIFGFAYELDSENGTFRYTYGDIEMIFNIKTGVLNVAGNEYAECQIISRGERLLCSVEYFADLLGYKVIQENGDYDITYLTAQEELLTDEKRAEAEERFELYRTVVCDTSDVEAEQNGVGKYAKTDYEDRLVGIAYSTWFESLSKWGEDKTWDLPLDGIYRSKDRDAIYRHGKLLADAGVDFVFVDWSNNTFYEPDVKYVWAMDMIESSTDLLFEIWSEIPNAPKICIMVGPGHMLGRDNPIESGLHQKKVNQVYNTYLNNPEHPEYADMYFSYEGKPLLICYTGTPTEYGADPSWTDSRFTVRWLTGYVGQQNKLIAVKTDLLSAGFWSWEERGTQTFTVLNGRVEAITCVAASRGDGTIPAYTRQNGATLKKQFQRANDLGAGVVLLSTWNEWILSEQISVEGSKDLEPSEQLGTFYYDLMTWQIAKYKGITLVK